MDAILTVVLEKASEQLISALGEELALIKNAPDELEKLDRLRKIIIIVQQDVAAQDLSQQHALDDCLNEMMDAAYDAEDTIELFNIDILRRRRSKNNSRRTARISHRVNDFFSFSSNPLIFRHKIGSRVRTTFGRLATIVKEKGYHLPLTARDGGVLGNMRGSMQESFSYMGGDVVLGREYDMKTVTEHLFKVQTDAKVVVLVGMGGVGKTALAKLVYNDSHADALFGKNKLWVCVSEIFNLPHILKLIIEQIDCQPCQLRGLHALTTKLGELLKGNSYLLVLDDVWTNAGLNRDSWSQLKFLFHNCKILVTTREEKVTSMIPNSHMHRVGCLPDDVCWILFKNVAFPDDDDTLSEDLKEIGKRIVKKCRGVPLAVRVLGSMMHAKKQEASDWLDVEKSNIFDTNYIDGEIEISGILEYCYNNLPLKSRSCFLYCSIFTKDSFMRKMDLLQQWTGNGFIHPSEANEIFMDLLARCFFQDVEKDEYGNIYSCKMHDLIHDLAQSIAKGQCRILDNSNYQDEFLSYGKNIRYLSIGTGTDTDTDIPIKLEDLHKLRTLQLQSFFPQIVNKHFLVNCFAKLKFLRVLNCNKANIKYVPSSIDNLNLLRYVDFSWTNIKQLPESLCNLQNLQTLKLNFCNDLVVLPKKLSKLTELRHLENEGCLYLDGMPVGMNHLSLLQTLNTFVVNEDGKNLNELRQLNHLRGNLRIQNLDRCRNFDLESGILSSKENLVSLDLQWGWEESEERDDEKILEALQPHPNLTSLKISYFKIICLPTWINIYFPFND